MKVEEQYEDVLQMMEYSIILVYRENPEMKDHDVRWAVDELIAFYRREEGGIAHKELTLNPLRTEIFNTVKESMEIRQETTGEIELKPIEGVGKEAALVYQLCLKRIKKSIEFWTKNNVRGYLNYVSRFV